MGRSMQNLSIHDRYIPTVFPIEILMSDTAPQPSRTTIQHWSRHSDLLDLTVSCPTQLSSVTSDCLTQLRSNVTLEEWKASSTPASPVTACRGQHFLGPD
ncbi:hypothetical protein J6590_084155 [Homalodisca vitripennis]|nr:hypothetical protein J6590_084155 [Homalodisca vitripennis]